MPRQARKKSNSGTYQIMLHGINRQQIFEDEEYRQHFLETLENYKDLCRYTTWQDIENVLSAVDFKTKAEIG